MAGQAAQAGPVSQSGVPGGDVRRSPSAVGDAAQVSAADFRQPMGSGGCDLEVPAVTGGDDVSVEVGVTTADVNAGDSVAVTME